MSPEQNGWNEWSRHVLAELERLNDCYNKLDTKMNRLFTEVAMLKVKSGVWGAIGGSMPVIAGVLWLLVKNK